MTNGLRHSQRKGRVRSDRTRPVPATGYFPAISCSLTVRSLARASGSRAWAWGFHGFSWLKNVPLGSVVIMALITDSTPSAIVDLGLTLRAYAIVVAIVVAGWSE